MKVRSDFVSNSSSCSFIIDSTCIKHTADVVDEKLYGLEVPYDIDKDICVFVYATNKNVDKLHQLMKDDMSLKVFHFEDEDPEELSWEYVELEVSQFINMMHDKDNSILDLIEKIEFSTDDYGSGPMSLRDFYDFFDEAGCNPNAECSEHEFMRKDSSSFRAALKGMA